MCIDDQYRYSYMRKRRNDNNAMDVVDILNVKMVRMSKKRYMDKYIGLINAEQKKVEHK